MEGAGHDIAACEEIVEDVFVAVAAAFCNVDLAASRPDAVCTVLWE